MLTPRPRSACGDLLESHETLPRNHVGHFSAGKLIRK